MSQPLLSHDEQLELLRRAKEGDSDAQETLLVHNVGLVKSIVRRFLNRGVEYDDLVQIGSLGLLKAIRNFDESYGVRFSTYAVPLVMGEIKRFLRDDGIVKVSRSIIELRQKAASVAEERKRALGRDPTIAEIAEELGMPAEEVVFAMESAQPCVSLYEPVFEDSNPVLMDRMDSGGDPSDKVDFIMLKQIISRLEARERQLIILRYFKGKTQTETAQALGVSQVQVSRMENRILARIREAAK